MRAWRASDRERNLVTLNAHRDFVLRAGERKPNPLLARQQRSFWQFLNHSGEFLGRERPVAIVAFRQILSRRHKGDGARAFAPDLFQHGIVVARADAKVAGDDLALVFVGQNTGEKPPALVAF